jgi:hypothetical protein
MGAGLEMPRKPSDLVQYKLRLPHELARQIDKLSTKSGRSFSAEAVRLLEGAVLAERVGMGGIDGVIKAVQHSSVESAVQEVLKQLDLEPTKTKSKPQVTKPSGG